MAPGSRAVFTLGHSCEGCFCMKLLRLLLVKFVLSEVTPVLSQLSRPGGELHSKSLANFCALALLRDGT